MFSEEFIDALRVMWRDKSMWSLMRCEAPKFPGDGVADMNGVARELVAKHADVFMWKFF